MYPLHLAHVFFLLLLFVNICSKFACPIFTPLSIKKQGRVNFNILLQGVLALCRKGRILDDFAPFSPL
jgi:hypothetical protein